MIVALKCVGCGADLDIEPDMGTFACAFCKTRQTVVSRGGTISLKPVIDALQQVRRGTDRTASELAIPRLERELVAALEAYKSELKKPVRLKRNLVQKTGIWILALSLVSFVAAGVTAGWEYSPAFIGVGLVLIFLGFLTHWIGANVRSRAQRAQLKAVHDGIELTHGAAVTKLKAQIAEHRALVDQAV